MQITILGSGSGVPLLKRNAPGLLIRIANQNLLLDSGPGIVKKLLKVGLTYHDIDYIFYTHYHTDHTLDLATLLFAAKYAISLRTRKLTLLGPPGLVKFYNNLLNLYGEVIRPQAYEITLQEIEEKEIQLPAFKITTLKMQHIAESIGYRIESNHKIVVYSGDTDSCPNLIKLGQNADILILDCSFPDEMKVKGHLIPGEAGEIAQRCSCKKLILSHLYPVCDSYDIARQAQRKFTGEVCVAYDLMTLTL